MSAESEQLVTVSVDLSTDFTIGQGLQSAAETLADFARSQVPCSTVTVAEGRVTVDFGELDDDCVYRGETYGGVVSWSVESASADEIQVNHTWTDFHTSKVRLTGSATVTWNLDDKTRRVVHERTWEVEDRTFIGTGDRTQSLLDESAGIWGGIQIDGTRGWTSDRGRWDLAIEGAWIKWDYPVPVGGRYVLTNPGGKVLTVTFELLGTRRAFEFTVSRWGAQS